MQRAGKLDHALPLLPFPAIDRRRIQEASHLARQSSKDTRHADQPAPIGNSLLLESLGGPSLSMMPAPTEAMTFVTVAMLATGKA